jgi:hypothetical protein
VNDWPPAASRLDRLRAPRRRKQRSDDPEQGDEDADDEHDPVALADRDDAEGDEQDDVDGAEENAGAGGDCKNWHGLLL